ncbi:hypothetical protein P167DRAFT_579664 [Morchella conica CCBAS932]|uniref:Uncharacterized protein n=1 Tax=Morchella conica CCBAS932 TaxID=1392247 RepID=A0A3N4K968_9PEZI|nr:hypothetical protein P167DRAFT_579664 [Morchella conica CCBAS932]
MVGTQSGEIKSALAGAKVKSSLGITPAQWRNVFEAVHDCFLENVFANRTMVIDEQWDKAMRLLLRAFVKVCLSSTIQNLAKHKFAENREKFSEALKEKECAAKLAKAKAVKKETKGKATDTKGKGKQRETASTCSSTNRSKQAQAPLPDDEDEGCANIDKFASSEDEAEKRRDKSDVKNEMDGEETCKETDEPFSAKTLKVERASYFTD